MIFKKTGKRSGDLIAFKGDFGVPVNFKTKDFSIGDQIRFKLVYGDGQAIKETFNVDSATFEFPLKLSEKQADTLAQTGKNTFFYTFKQYSEDGQFLDTVLNGKLFLKETIQWQN